MNPETTGLLRQLVFDRPVAALGTLHDGLPFVSMVPFAVSPDGGHFVIHISRLAAHTKDLQATPEVCLMIAAADDPETMPQALARVSIPGVAHFVAEGSADHGAFRAAYLAKFPSAEPLFDFPDFSLVAISPRSARFIAGFAQASTLSAETLRRALAMNSGPGTN
jgi:heme iron utilization protein